MNLGLLLQQSRPVLLLLLLLPQHEIETARAMLLLALLRNNLVEELQVNDVLDTLAGLSVELDGGRCDLQIGVFWRDIGGVDADEKDVLRGVGGVGALGPGDFGVNLCRHFCGRCAGVVNVKANAMRCVREV